MCACVSVWMCTDILQGEGYAQHLWLADSLNWSTFLRKGVDVAQFLADKNLTYTSTDTMRQLVETDASVDEFMRHISVSLLLNVLKSVVRV